MHTITINVKDSVIDKIIYLLKNLSDIEIVEDKKTDHTAIKLEQVKGILKDKIQDPVKYQQNLRDEWENRIDRECK